MLLLWGEDAGLDTLSITPATSWRVDVCIYIYMNVYINVFIHRGEGKPPSTEGRPPSIEDGVMKRGHIRSLRATSQRAG